LIKLVFYLFLVEVFLGGGGRLLDFGSVSPRMVFYICGLFVYFLYLMVVSKISEIHFFSINYVLVYILVTGFGAFNGVINGSNLDYILRELTLSSVFILLPLFSLNIKSMGNVKFLSNVIMYSGIFLSLGYLVFLFLLAVNIISLSTVYSYMSTSDEFSFRSDYFFFYKGFIYIPIALFLLLNLELKFRKTLVVLMTAALLLTLTRSFVVAFMVPALVGTFIKSNISQRLMLIVGVTVIVFIGFLNLDLLYKPDSDSHRIADLMHYYHTVNAKTFLLGDGLGSLLNGRFNVENSFLWALWKLGIVGLCFWLSPFIFACLYFYKILNDKSAVKLKYAHCYFGIVLLIYTQSLFNPYVNNVIGLAVVMVSLLSLRVLSDKRILS
jgi:hypothetical protein